MDVEYDPAKNEKNIRERGLSFERVREFDFDTAISKSATRNGEIRWLAIGYLDGLLHALCFVDTPFGIRVISFRRAGKRERREYERDSRMSAEMLEELKDTEDWTDDEGEIRELTRADFARMKPFSALPLELQTKLLALKGTAAPVANQDTIPVPVSRAVVEQFRAGGDGWQGRVDMALREWLDEHKAS